PIIQISERVKSYVIETTPAFNTRSDKTKAYKCGLHNISIKNLWRCGRLLAFLLQVYALLPGSADAFHRCLFLFCFFRNQLPRKNEFYSNEPPSENPSPETESVCLQLKSGAPLCRVCGCLGPKTCSRCHQAHYCSKEHQTLDWRLGHKQACTQDHLDHTVPDHKFLFPEFGIVIETEEEIVPQVVEKEEDFEITGMLNISKTMSSNGITRIWVHPSERLLMIHT
uniref:Programmed cell death protein 2 n=1 Tax=Urocitellus parryii TaxID=9999 RepID=A0A8D2GL39_UROPR